MMLNSTEESCDAVLDYRGYDVCCLRVKDHEPPCMAMACDAMAADDRRLCCFTRNDAEHDIRCIEH